MKLILVRHGLAGNKLKFASSGRHDSVRPLTEKGIKRMKKAAKGLKNIIRRPDAVISSPYIRARQTADILGKALGVKKIEEFKALEPESKPEGFLSSLNKFSADSLVFLVGHEPHLGAVISECLAGSCASFITLRKGGACMIEFEGKRIPGKAALVWLLEPEQLELLA